MVHSLRHQIILCLALCCLLGRSAYAQTTDTEPVAAAQYAIGVSDCKRAVLFAESVSTSFRADSAWLLLAEEAHWCANENQQALAYLREYLKRFPNDAAAQRRLGSRLFYAQKSAEREQTEATEKQAEAIKKEELQALRRPQWALVRRSAGDTHFAVLWRRASRYRAGDTDARRDGMYVFEGRLEEGRIRGTYHVRFPREMVKECPNLWRRERCSIRNRDQCNRHSPRV